MTMTDTLTLVEKTAFLKSLPMLTGIPTEALAQLASRSHEVHLDAGETLIRTGEPTRGPWLVVEGQLEQRIGDALVRVLGPGMAFGELFLGEGQPTQYTVRALAHSHVINLTRDDVLEALVDFPELAVSMVRSFALRVHELTVHTVDLERLIARLQRALEAAGLPLPEPDQSVGLPAPRPDEML